MANNQYPNPPKQYLLKEIVSKMYDDCGYAQFIRDQIAKARAGDPAAKKTVDAQFQADPTELDALGIPKTAQSDFAACTDPKTRLLDFVDVKTAV